MTITNEYITERGQKKLADLLYQYLIKRKPKSFDSAGVLAIGKHIFDFCFNDLSPYRKFFVSASVTEIQDILYQYLKDEINIDDKGFRYISLYFIKNFAKSIRVRG